MDMFMTPEQPAPRAAPVDEGFTFRKPVAPLPQRSPRKQAPSLAAVLEHHDPEAPGPAHEGLAVAHARIAQLEQENQALQTELQEQRRAAKAQAKRRQALRLDAEALHYQRQQLAVERAELAQEAARLNRLQLQLEAQAAALSQQQQQQQQAPARAQQGEAAAGDKRPNTAAVGCADSRESSPRGSTGTERSSADPADIGDSAASIHGRRRSRMAGQAAGKQPPPPVKRVPEIEGMHLAVADAWEPIAPNSPTGGAGSRRSSRDWAEPPAGGSILDSLKNWGTNLEDLLQELPPPPPPAPQTPPQQPQPRQQKHAPVVSPFQAAAMQGAAIRSF